MVWPPYKKAQLWLWMCLIVALTLSNTIALQCELDRSTYLLSIPENSITHSVLFNNDELMNIVNVLANERASLPAPTNQNGGNCPLNSPIYQNTCTKLFWSSLLTKWPKWWFVVPDSMGKSFFTSLPLLLDVIYDLKIVSKKVSNNFSCCAI